MDHRIVVRLPVAETTDFDALVGIENGLAEMLAKHRAGRIERHEFGHGRFSVFIASNESPESTLGRIRAFLEFHGSLREAVIATCTADGGDDRVLWPPDDGRGLFR